MRSMTPEEERFERIERIMEFLAANQAELSASSKTHADMLAENARQIASNSEQIARNSEQIARNSEQMGQLMDLTLRIGRIVEEQARRLDTLGKETDQRIKALADAQIRTDNRLNAVINMVDRYFSE